MVAVEDVFMLLRALKGPELACLVAILMSPKPARMAWLKAVTGLSDHTVSQSLTVLSSLGLAQDDGRRSHWIPAGGFCEAFLKRAEEGLGVGERPALSPSGQTDEPPSGLPADGIEESESRVVTHPTALPEGETHTHGNQTTGRGSADRKPANRGIVKSKHRRKRGKNGVQVELGAAYSEMAPSDPINTMPANRGPAIRGHAIRGSPENSLSLKEEELKNLELTSASGFKADAPRNASTETAAHNPNAPGFQDDGSHKARTRRILAATQLLFGEMVLGPPERYPDLNLLLGSIAEAYSQRQRLRNPARVVYANLAKGALPAPEFLQDPAAHLPDRYLIAAGLAQPIHGDHASYPDEDGWEDTVASLAQESSPPCRDDATLELPVGAGAAEDGGRSACQAWKAVSTVLLGEMPLSTYQRYIAPLELAHFERKTCTFSLQAQDEFSRAWLEDRMHATLEHLLSGICNRKARVILTT